MTYNKISQLINKDNRLWILLGGMLIDIIF